MKVLLVEYFVCRPAEAAERDACGALADIYALEIDAAAADRRLCVHHVLASAVHGGWRVVAAPNLVPPRFVLPFFDRSASTENVVYLLINTTDQEVRIDWLAANTLYEFWFSSVSPVGPGEYLAVALYTLAERMLYTSLHETCQ